MNNFSATKMKRGWISLLSMTAFGAAFVSGCTGNGNNAANNSATSGTPTSTGTNGATTGKDEVKTVRIGYLPNIVMPQPLLGLGENEYSKRVPGVTFTGRDYPAGPAVLEALRARTIDIAYTGPYPPIKAFSKNKDVVLLAGCATGGTEIVVSKNAPYKTMADLKGKVVGVNQIGSTVDAMVRHNLIKVGLQPGKDVRMIEIKPADQASALLSGQIAAVAAPAPWPSQVELKGNGRPLLDSKQILDNGNYLAGVVFTTKKFANENPQLVKQFVAAHRAITAELNKDRTKGDVRVLNAWSKISRKTLPADVAKKAFSTIQFTDATDLKTIERDQDIAVETGILKKKSDLTGFLYAP